MAWRGRSIVSILDFSRNELEELFQEAYRMEEQLSKGRVEKILDGRIIAMAFFEPSTRTRLSFETAAKRLGASVIGFTGEEAISVAKGENLADTIRMLSSYADLIVIRHRYEGAALYASEISSVPVINGGDGRQHHPTQAMLDLYTVSRELGRIDGLVYGVLGDLRYGRAAASFILGLTRFKPEKVYLISPPNLGLRREVRMLVEDHGLPVEEARLEDVIGELDVLYVTRVQKERFPDPEEYERVKGAYRITPSTLEGAKGDMIIMHPLPRVDEIDHRIDATRHAKYFKQAAYGIPVRMAILKLVLAG
ncbi:MAG: aspartate carbamoyltransferase [Desulfurococcales archaeon]|nr:aspartate carbamoyltransferase [Desulfurococcales archaeon]MCE4605282.1 aspartate carbamoyltransferase [Desulfurococcales archaeon]